MVEYKLYYFESRGFGELSRLIFAAAGQKYEDVRIPKNKWPEWKPKAPFGQAPYLEIIDGSNISTYSQSRSIARYLAKKFGLAGKNDEETAIIDMYVDQLTDLMPEIAKIHHETNQEKKKELMDKLEKEILPVHLKYFDDQMAKSGSGFIVSSGLSWADLHIYTLCDYFPHKNKLLEQFKHIKENRDKIEANPGIAHWLKVRPVTEY